VTKLFLTQCQEGVGMKYLQSWAGLCHYIKFWHRCPKDRRLYKLLIRNIFCMTSWTWSTEARLTDIPETANLTNFSAKHSAQHIKSCLLAQEMFCPDGKRKFNKSWIINPVRYTRVYPKVSGLAPWSENCKWYHSCLPIGAVV